jgi:predicted TPR repeat methyltransferase
VSRKIEAIEIEIMGNNAVSSLEAKAASLMESGKLSEARTVCEQICAADGGNSHAWLMLGKLAEQQGDLETAVINYVNAIQIHPRETRALTRLGILHQIRREIAAAEKYYRESLLHCRDQPVVHFNLGVMAQEQNKLDDAVNCYTCAINASPNYAAAHANLAYVLRRQNRTRESVESYKRALQLLPDDPQILLNYGIALQAEKRSQDAATSYRSAIRLKPDYADAYFTLGHLLFEQGQAEEASKMFEAGLRYAPGNDIARYFLAAFRGNAAPSAAPPTYVQSLFDGYAEGFDKSLVDELGYHIPVAISQAVREVIDQSPSGYRVLDLGCGTGLVGKRFRDIAESLTGVDLSPKMIEKCRSENTYDLLYVDEVVNFLRSRVNAYDLAVAADVFIYIGELSSVFTAASNALEHRGLFAFSIEAANEDETYTLHSHLRYAHSIGYIQRLSAIHGFEELVSRRTVIRTEGGKPVNGYVVVLRNLNHPG